MSAPEAQSEGSAGGDALAGRLAARFSLQLVRWTAPVTNANAKILPATGVSAFGSAAMPAMTDQTAAATVQETYQFLFDEAHRALLQGGSFKPFGAGVRPDGERTQMHVDLPVERSTPQHYIAALIQGMRQEAAAKRLLVAGLVIDGGLMTPDGDASAIVVHMEAEGGESVQVTIPYQRLIETGEIHFKEPQVAAATREIFEG